ncbi:MAG: DUF1292 domain-containing protein [Clostridia bacterium]|nr:DUF1292 domain-containing protein [Clostridia bacterium]
MSDETKRIEDEEMDVITLEFDDGTEVEAEIMGIFDVPAFPGKEYIALIPDDDTDDVYIYGYKEISEEEFELIDIEDDDEFDKVVEEFDKITAEE